VAAQDARSLTNERQGGGNKAIATTFKREWAIKKKGSSTGSGKAGAVVTAIAVKGPKTTHLDSWKGEAPVIV